MTSATTRKVIKLMPPVGVKIKLVSTAGAAARLLNFRKIKQSGEKSPNALRPVRDAILK